MLALVVGAGGFPEVEAGEFDGSEVAEFSRLPSVEPAVQEMVRSLRRLDGVDVHGGTALLNPDKDSVERVFRRVRDGGRPLLVHFAGHGIHLPEAASFFLPLRGSTRGCLPDTAWEVGSLLASVEGTAQSSHVLLLLDACGAGRAAVHQFAHRVRPADRKAWVIAACASEEQAFGARFTTATAAVLERLRRGQMDVSPDLEFVPVETLAEEIDRELARSGGEEKFTQTVVRTARLEASAPVPPFFANPAYSGDAKRRLQRRLETALWEFAAEADNGLDPVHFLYRASGAPPNIPALQGCWFTGRDEQLAVLRDWFNDGSGNPPSLFVLTGSPGAGKSALLGAIVCLTHPALQEVASLVATRIPEQFQPDRHEAIAAVHARGRSPEQILESIANQLDLRNPGRGLWTTAELGAAIGRAFPQPPIVVVDALDEAMDPVLVLDECLLPLSVTEDMSRKRPVCRVLIGTRPWSSFGKLWQAAAGQRITLRSGDESHAAMRPVMMDLDLVPEQRVAADLGGYLAAVLRPLRQYPKTAERQSVADAVAAKLSGLTVQGPYLLASLFAQYLAELPEGLDPDTAVSRLPVDLAGMLTMHMRALALNDPWRSAVQQALAHARGSGMPLELIHAATDAFAPAGTEATWDDTRRALTDMAYYLRTTVGVDGRLLYRYFHQSLIDDLREREDSGRLLAQLLKTVPTVGGTPDRPRRAWHLASSYLLRHAYEHADAAGSDWLDALIEDPAFLVHSHASLARLQGTSPRARRHAAVCRGLRLPGPSSAQARLQVLRLAAVMWRDQALRDELDRVAIPEPSPVALPQWATTFFEDPARGFTGDGGFSDDWHTMALTTIGPTHAAITGSETGDVRVWNLGNGSLIHDLAGHPDETVTAAAGGLIGAVPVAVTGSANGAVRVWELNGGTLLYALAAGEEVVTAIGIIGLAQGPAVVVGGCDSGTARLWDLATGALVRELPGGSAAITAIGTLAMADAPIAIIGGSADPAARVWDLNDGKVLHSLHGAGGWMEAAAGATCGGLTLGITVDPGGAQIWNLATGDPVGMPLPVWGTLRALSADPAGVFIAADSGIAFFAWNAADDSELILDEGRYRT